MTEDLSPSLALDTATALRAAADQRPYPAWFPPAMGIGYAASLSLMGISYLMHGAASRVFGLTGAALVVLTFATMLPVVLGWRRAGVVPKFDDCDVDPARRRQQLWSAGLAAAGAAAAMVLVVVAQWGWIEIAFGLVIGVQTWRRLARRAVR
ncbi:hypothetical protein [Catenulispora pinisilvae]|uniref:hypothetical protein n=1 Tax=Catenulispora pinisilvae TaxID=2705253 RepID=UPI00189148C7|nr:hypothetical protein [Catenulispora pinisilvae]